MEVGDPPVPVDHPRYSTRNFPLYRFIPGQTPHPRRHPRGHSFGFPEPRPRIFTQNEWSASEDYLYAMDLYNFAYWWESHEVFEGLWHVFGHSTQEGNFFKALIQLAAANLKRILDNEAAVKNLTQHGLERLRTLPPQYMGLDTIAVADHFMRWLSARRNSQVLIRLDLPSGHHLIAQPDRRMD